MIVEGVYLCICVATQVTVRHLVTSYVAVYIALETFN